MALVGPSSIKLLSDGTLELVAEVASPAGGSQGRMEACALSPDGSTLLASTRGGQLLSYSLQNPCRPHIQSQRRQGHRYCAPCCHADARLAADILPQFRMFFH